MTSEHFKLFCGVLVWEADSRSGRVSSSRVYNAVAMLLTKPEVTDQPC